MDTTHPKPFRFEDLPIEIRDLVYQFCLINNDHPLIPTETSYIPALRYHHATRPKLYSATRLCIDSHNDEELQSWPEDAYGAEYVQIQCSDLALSLLQTSRLIRNEALPVFLGRNHWVFESIYDISMFLVVMGNDARFVRSMTINPDDCFVRGLGRPLPHEIITEVCNTCVELSWMEVVYTWAVPEPFGHGDSHQWRRWMNAKRFCKSRGVALSLLLSDRQCFSWTDKDLYDEIEKWRW